MSNGQKFNMNKISFAHRYFPLGTLIRVRNTLNNKSVVGFITDRGPYIRGRILDISLAAAKQLDIVKIGVARVEITILVYH